MSEHLADQCNRLPRPLARARLGRDLSHKRPGALSHLHEPLGLEVAVRLHDRRGVHAQLSGQLAHGGQGGGWAQLTRRNGQPHAVGDLLVQGDWAAGVEMLEHRYGICIIVAIQ